MRIYRIELNEGDLCSASHYILAKDFFEAEHIADKLLAVKLKAWKDSEIVAIVEEFEIEVVK